MAINWDVSKIADKYKDSVDEWAITQTLIYVGGAIGIGSITEKNVEQYAARLAFYQQLRGPLMQEWKDGGKPEPRLITTEEVYRRIGLTTNWSTETDAAWRRRIVAEAFKDTESLVRKDLAALRAAADIETAAQ
jgi:hypothetical protein